MKSIFILITIIGSLAAKAQKVDALYVHLYTDSLKKGTYNYINVDGLLSTGNYLPLDSTKILFSCPQARFYGNTLFIPANFSEEKVYIKAELREDHNKFKEFIIYIKKAVDPPLRSAEEVLSGKRRRG